MLGSLLGSITTIFFLPSFVGLKCYELAKAHARAAPAGPAPTIQTSGEFVVEKHLLAVFFTNLRPLLIIKIIF
jgi:hypothetical protein